MQVSVGLLAGPSLFRNDVELSRSSNRTSLFFSYLAYQADWVSRDALLVLFWPYKRETQARKNLRTLLYKAKQEPYAENLEIAEDRVRWLVQTDVAHFQEAIAQADWQTAVDLYKGPFLENYKSSESTELEDWLEQIREELQLSWQDSAIKVAREKFAEAKFNEAQILLKQVIAADFLAEDAVRLLIQVQASSGQKNAALETFQAFQKQLSAELNMPVTAETRLLADQIKEANVRAKTDIEVPKALSPRPMRAAELPQALTPFIGRTLELLDLAQLLAEPHVRLVTLLGHGGMGKSRLALQVLEEQKDKFKDGVAFISLAPLSVSRDIPIAVAKSLDLNLTGDMPVQDEVIRFLKDKQMLLVFDNYEHLLEGAQFVQDLLTHVQQSKFLCTSRELLQIPNEHIYDLMGLNVPTDNDESHFEASDSVQFFLRSARRVSKDFRLEQGEKADLINLCRKLQGMPLALELAATWLRLFSIHDLIKELDQDLDLLESSGQEVDERHKSMRIVFEQSFSLLNDQEKQVLAQLSVFQGGFDRKAAATVADASVRVLLSLVNKSLLRTTASGRFSILEVVKQYAAEKLSNQSAYKNHAEYYLNLVVQQGQQFYSKDPKPHLLAVEQNLENVKTAWRWAVKENAFEDIARAERELSFYFDIRARLQEGITLFQEAIEPLTIKQSNPAVLAKLLVSQATLYRWAGMTELSHSKSEEATGLINPEDDYETYCEALTALSFAYELKGDLARAKTYIDKAFNLAKESNNEDLQLTTTKALAFSEHMIRNYQEAEQLYKAALKAYRQKDDTLRIAEVLSNYGEMKLELGQLLEAKRMLIEALDRASRNGDTGFMHICKAQLAYCAYEEADYETAQYYSDEALKIIRDGGGKHDELRVLSQIVLISVAEARFHDAIEHLGQLKVLIEELASFAELMEVYFVFAEYLYAKGLNKEASLFYDAVRQHKSSRVLYKQKAQKRVSSAIKFQLNDESFKSYLGFLETRLERIEN